MSKWNRTWTAGLVVVALAAFAGCQQRGDAGAENDGDMDMAEDTAMMGDTGMEDDAAAGADAGMASAGQVAVTNSMSHAMIVSADGGQGAMELGSVGPSETRTFDVESAGAPVTLTASDSATTHTVSGTVSPSGATPAEWTIQ